MASKLSTFTSCCALSCPFLLTRGMLEGPSLARPIVISATLSVPFMGAAPRPPHRGRHCQGFSGSMTLMDTACQPDSTAVHLPSHWRVPVQQQLLGIQVSLNKVIPAQRTLLCHSSLLRAIALPRMLFGQRPDRQEHRAHVCCWCSDTGGPHGWHTVIRLSCISTIHAGTCGC